MVVDTPLGLAVPLLDWEKGAGPWRLQQAYHSFLHLFVKLRLQLNLLLGCISLNFCLIGMVPGLSLIVVQYLSGTIHTFFSLSVKISV